MAAKRQSQSRARTRAAGPPRTPRARPSRAGGGARALPRRWLLIGAAALVALGGAYALARQTSVFALRRIDVRGGGPSVQAQAQQALAPLLGRSLVGLNGSAVRRRVEALPTVARATYDRAFPHTLRVTVVPEHPVAALRAGKGTWLVSARGRVISPVARGADPGLPRIWAPAATPIDVGGYLDAADGAAAARALALAARFPAAIRSASFAHATLVFRLRSGLALRLGDPTDVRLKLAIARRALALLPTGATYLDVSVPQRPVAGTNPQVSS